MLRPQRRLRLMLLLITAASLLSPLWQPSSYAQSEREVYLLQASGPITPAMAEYLARGVELATGAGAEALVFQLDTPGGAIDVMNSMVQTIRASEVPVIVYVAPRGAIAGSAGTVIALAGHAAGMAPETAIGAASPVGGQGEDLGETIETKEKEILKATVRGLASRRGQAAIELAEATIEEAVAASADEALAVGLIDVIAEDVEALLLQLDGQTVVVNDQERQLRTASASIVTVPQTLIEQLLQALTNPTLVFLLLTLGVQAVLIELSSPGGWVAGFIGVVSLALAGYGLGILPVNWFGLIFVATAFGLFLLEIKATTHGALALAGLASLTIGALVLFNSPGTPEFLRISLPVVFAVAIGMGAVFLFIVSFAIRAQRRPVEVGTESLVGKSAPARTDIDPAGTVHVAGELWRAVLAEGADPVAAGESAEIVAVDGLKLIVRGVGRVG